MDLTMHHTFPKSVLIIKNKSPVEDDDIEIVGTMPAINR